MKQIELRLGVLLKVHKTIGREFLAYVRDKFNRLFEEVFTDETCSANALLFNSKFTLTS